MEIRVEGRCTSPSQEACERKYCLENGDVCQYFEMRKTE